MVPTMQSTISRSEEDRVLSKDVARLSGVTVRALRHYHQMGILPEPPRRDNGYREYGAVDVARTPNKAPRVPRCVSSSSFEQNVQ